MDIHRIATLKTAGEFRGELRRLGVSLPFDEAIALGPEAPLAKPLVREPKTIGNRFAILPMEGWDGTSDGRPTDLTRRRWERFGRSGAKLIWGGEAVAVRPDGRANPHQLLLNDATLADLQRLLAGLRAAHVAEFGRDDDLCVGLQLTHSGRFSRPHDKRRLEPRVAYRHPLLDPRFGLRDDLAVVSDDEVARLVEDFGRTASLALRVGFDFVDVKCCHGYLGHEFLSAVDRPGPYGGSLANRSRFFREVVEAIRDAAPGLEIGVRLSLFDFVPFRTGHDGRGEPVPADIGPYPYAFGGDRETGLVPDLAETSAFLDIARALGIRLICTTAGNPYTNPHILRPAAFPPSDGYLPPEDPLIGVARQVAATAAMKASHPDLIFVGSAYSYLQEWLPNVGQAVIRGGGADFIGLGRMVLSYPEMPADVLAGRPLARKKVCRTFSDCTTAPRIGEVSGCYPLDPFYKARPEREAVAASRPERNASGA